MNVVHHSSSGRKPTTPPHHLLITAIVGGALAGFIATKSPEARSRLESVADMARRLGELSPADSALVSGLLAQPVKSKFNLE